MALPSRLLTPATLIFKAINDANVPAILFGGAAAKLNGARRETKVLLSIFFFLAAKLTVSTSGLGH
jgi:hypothetical protein